MIVRFDETDFMSNLKFQVLKVILRKLMISFALVNLKKLRYSWRITRDFNFKIQYFFVAIVSHSESTWESLSET